MYISLYDRRRPPFLDIRMKDNAFVNPVGKPETGKVGVPCAFAVLAVGQHQVAKLTGGDARKRAVGCHGGRSTEARLVLMIRPKA